MQCYTYRSFLGKGYSFLLHHDTYRRKGEEKTSWQSASFSGTCCDLYPRHSWSSGQSSHALPSQPSSLLINVTLRLRKAANLRPDSLSSFPYVITSQSRTSLHSNKCEACWCHWSDSSVQQRKIQPLKLDSDLQLNHLQVRISLPQK